MTDPIICTAHPADRFEDATAELLSELSGARAVCVNPTLGTPLESMVDELEAERLRRGIGRWWFWGMSGGGWLAELYAHRYPQALSGVIIESACACFRARVADPSCLISPFHPMWKEKLGALGLIDPHSHDQPRAKEDTELTAVEGIGEVLRAKRGPALIVLPGPQTDAMRAAMPRFYTYDARPWINTLKLPALVIAGTADPVIPVSHVRAVHEAIAGSKFLTVEGAGHIPSATKSEGVVQAVRALLAQG